MKLTTVDVEPLGSDAAREIATVTADERNAVVGAPRREVLLRLGQVLAAPLQLQHVHEAAADEATTRTTRRADLHALVVGHEAVVVVGV
jgi:hypothetical protein